MKKYFLLIAFLIIGTVPFLSTSPTDALSGSDFRAGRIIDDSVFFNSSTMSPVVIQQFLNSKVPTCDTNGTQPIYGTTRAAYGTSQGNPPPYTCLKDYRQDTPHKPAETGLCGNITPGNRSGAEIIYDVSIACGINPQVFIVLLQKEQSLITDDWPWPVQYRSATGYGCPDTAPCDAEYYGFFNQVYSAGRQFKKYARDASFYQYRAGRDNYIQFNPNAACGGSTVFIENQATANLYNYTPYQPNTAALNNLYGTGDGCSAYGNRNFWRMFNDWFGTTTGTPLVRTPTNPTYYLLSNNKKFAIPNGDILYAYGLQTMELTYVSDSYLASITDGGILSTLFTVPGNPTVFLADGNKKYGIASGEYCTKWGLSCGNPAVQKELGHSTVNTMFDGGVLGNVMLHQGAKFAMINGKKNPFFSQQAVVDNGYSALEGINIINYTNAIRPIGQSLFQNYSLVKFASSDTLYLYNSSNFYTFSDFAAFNSWKNLNTPLFIDSVSERNSSLPIPLLTLKTIVRLNDNNVYILDAGSKIATGSLSANLPSPQDLSSFPNLTSLFNTRTTMSNLSTFRNTSGVIFEFASGTKRPFASMTDFIKLGKQQSNVINLSTNNLVEIPVGNILIAEGRLFKKPADETIYVTATASTSHALTSLSQLGQFVFDTSSVPRLDTTSAGIYTNQGALSSVIEEGSTVSVISEGKRLIIPSNIATDYNTSGLTKSNFSTASLQNLTTLTLDRFVKSSGGTIYYVTAGTKRPFTTYDAFKQLGGTPNNTHLVPQDFLNQLPTGASI